MFMGIQLFKIYDKSLLGNANTILLKEGQQSKSFSKEQMTNTLDDPCEIIEIWYDPTAEECHCSGDEYYTGEWYYEGDCYVSPTIPIILPSGGGNVYSLPNTGPGGGGGGGSNNPPYASAFSEKLNYLLNNLDLSPESSEYLPTSQETVNELYHYLYNNSSFERIYIASQYAQRIANDPEYASFIESYRQYRSIYSGSTTTLWWQDNGFLSPFGGLGFGSWAINYLSQDPTLPFSTFQNWFFNTPEYTDGEELIDPNLITYDDPVTQTTLPSLSAFTTYFPKLGTPGNYTYMPSQQVYQLVGGSLYSNHLQGYPAYQNACALRGSRALLYSGITIPVIRHNGSQRTEKGSDNKNYILDAVSFEKFMKDKFGDTPHKLEGNDANTPQKVADLLKGKNGIYVIINNNSGPSPTGAGYSGHVDLILNGNCLSGAYTTPTGGVKSIKVWVLN